MEIHNKKNIFNDNNLNISLDEIIEKYEQAVKMHTINKDFYRSKKIRKI